MAIAIIPTRYQISLPIRLTYRSGATIPTRGTASQIGVCSVRKTTGSGPVHRHWSSNTDDSTAGTLRLRGQYRELCAPDLPMRVAEDCGGGRGAQGRDGPHRQQILLFQILTDPSSLGFVPQSCASSIVLIARFDHGQSKEHQANNCNSSRDSYALQYSHGEASTKLRRIAKATRTTPRKSPLVSSNATNAIARA